VKKEKERERTECSVRSSLAGPEQHREGKGKEKKNEGKEDLA